MNYSGITHITNSEEKCTLFIIDKVNGNTYTQVQIVDNSLILEYPECDRFQVIRPCGLTFELASTPSQYMSFYTALMKQYNVQLYIDSQLVFEGYLNSENFSETYSRPLYRVQFVANNSFTLLKRINTTLATNELQTQFDVICDCLDSLDYNQVKYLYVNLSTTAQQISGYTSSETILHRSLINTYNFYDENGEALTKYEVLESILKPYCAFIIMKDGCLYISDYNVILSGITSFKKYDIQNNYAYVGSQVINTDLGDLRDFSTQNLHFEILPAKNQAKVKFSPYANNQIIDYTVKTANELTSQSLVINTDSQYGFTYDFYSNTSDNNKNILLYDAKLMQVRGTGSNNSQSSGDYILLTGNTTGSTAFKINNILSNLINYNFYGHNDYPKFYLKLAITAFFRTKDSYKKDSETTNGNLKQAFLYGKLKVGNKYFKLPAVKAEIPAYKGSWEDSEQIMAISFFNSMAENQPMGDVDKGSCEYQYVEAKSTVLDACYVPLFHQTLWLLPFILSGQVEFEILNAFKGIDWRADDYTGVIKDVWVKSVDITLVDSHRQTISDCDYEKIAYFDSNYSEELEESQLIFGDSQSLIPSERGAIFLNVPASVNKWTGLTDPEHIYFASGHTREGVTASLQSLYLRSLLNNYKESRFKLSGKVVNNLVMVGGYMTNNSDSYFNNKKMIVIGSKLNICANQSDVIMIEIQKDIENISEE